MSVIFFKNQEEFRTWLEYNHKIEKECFVGFYKVATKKPSMTWSQSVDQALCFGWIDGIRRSIDKESYCIRFTPRRPTSSWSEINIKKVEHLTKAGLMKSAGIDAFKKRREDYSGENGNKNESPGFSPEFEKRFKRNQKAWQFFYSQPPSYRKLAIRWVMSAKLEKTQITRLEKLIGTSGKGKRIY
jgi:uncharacterized protein YdeI (YjbR/CyaY-like superfamily)